MITAKYTGGSTPILMSVLVTGATGWLGAFVARRFALDERVDQVHCVIRAKDDEDAMRIANDSRYGLGGGIFTKDQDKAIRLARDHFDTGMIRVNSFGAADPNMPFGGVKDSGYGREHGGFGMKEFVNAKAIFLP